MRSLIRELPYERPIAGGRYHYERGGEPTGAVETWRLSHAAEGYRFLRVDLNAQTARSGHSYLYHLTLDPEGHPDRLSFRFFGRKSQIRGEALFERDYVTLTRTVNGSRLEEEVAPAADYRFWFPATAGLSLLATLGNRAAQPALTMSQADDFALRTTELASREEAAQGIEIMGNPVAARRLTLRWADQKRTIWLDEHNWPVRMQRDELVAVETRYLRYGGAE